MKFKIKISEKYPEFKLWDDIDNCRTKGYIAYGDIMEIEQPRWKKVLGRFVIVNDGSLLFITFDQTHNAADERNVYDWRINTTYRVKMVREWRLYNTDPWRESFYE